LVAEIILKMMLPGARSPLEGESRLQASGRQASRMIRITGLLSEGLFQD
jgi:hypothetical protein